jgi:uncharacterized protein (DUF302 family)
MRFFSTFAAVLFTALPLSAGEDLSPRAGWSVIPTAKSFEVLLKDTRAAVKASGMFVVTQAGPTAAAKKRGITIPGNRIIGVFNNVFAVKVLETSTPAMIEAPIRLYITENENGTATLAYKSPTAIFSAYTDEGGQPLKTLATELDSIFASIAQDAGN